MPTPASPLPRIGAAPSSPWLPCAAGVPVPHQTNARGSTGLIPLYRPGGPASIGRSVLSLPSGSNRAPRPHGSGSVIANSIGLWTARAPDPADGSSPLDR